MLRLGCSLAAAVALAASTGCAGDDDAGPPRYTTVVVLALETGAPIAGATIELAETEAGITGVDGSVVIEVPAGRVAIRATEAAHRPGAFVGEPMDELTLLLAAEPAGTGTVRGSIPGWVDQPAPGPGRLLAAWIDPSQAVIGLFLSGVPPRPLPTAVCATRDPASGPCTFDLAVPAGAAAIAATVVELDDGGTPDPADDGLAAIRGFAVASGLEVAAGAVLSDVALTAAPPMELMASLPDPSGELAEVIGVPGLGFGRQVILFRTLHVPDAAEGRRWLVVDGHAAAREDAGALRIARDVSAGATIDVGPLPSPPQIAHEGTTGVIDIQAAGGPIFVAARGTSDGSTRWTAWLDAPGTFDTRDFGLALDPGTTLLALDLPPGTTPETMLEANTVARRADLIP